MDEIGVHSLLNAKKSIVPDVGTTSPVQTVAGKDESNPLMAVTLPKSEAEEENSSKTRQNPENNQNLDSIDHVSETSSDNEFLESNYAQDPNENYDSGMSFDSVALHSLDT
ncbi:hypothetical protein RND71_042146 [Anisodus tanguticus]|uniref:Uncharacterized protein n=1 Tax=Anisodus tanguticus TaxID=243964 RepID=A0AAE1UUJ0_9SOLA|nr:hypothetical protein RND71_042146 [Anisodus tanguticus]